MLDTKFDELLEFPCQFPFKIIGFPDEYMVNGSQSDVLDYYNMSPEKLAKMAEDLLK